VRKLEQHGWPGNVRELRNVIERAVYVTDGASLDPDDLQLAAHSISSGIAFELPAEGIDIGELERALVVQALERTRGNVTHAARLLRMNRDQMRYRVQKYGLAELGG
jgi:DNA-binding NtrC family response regulator